MSLLSLLTTAFQVDKKADEIASCLSQKCPTLDASRLRDMSEQRFVPAAKAMGQADMRSFEKSPVTEAEQGRDKRYHAGERIKGERGRQNSTCNRAEKGLEKKSFVLVKIFVNPSRLEHGLVLQRAKWLAEEDVVRKLPSYINSLDRKKFTCNGIFF